MKNQRRNKLYYTKFGYDFFEKVFWSLNINTRKKYLQYLKLFVFEKYSKYQKSYWIRLNMLADDSGVLPINPLSD